MPSRGPAARRAAFPGTGRPPPSQAEGLPRPAAFERDHGAGQEGERDQVGEGFAHAGQGPGRKEDSRPGEPAAEILHRQEPPEQGREDQPREDVEEDVDLDDPAGIAAGQEPGERGRQDAPAAIGEIVDRAPQLRGAQEGVIGDLGVGDAVVGAGVLEDIHRLGAEFGDLFRVVRAVELDERRQAPHRVPKAGHETSEEEDGGDAQSRRAVQRRGCGRISAGRYASQPRWVPIADTPLKTKRDTPCGAGFPAAAIRQRKSFLDSFPPRRRNWAGPTAPSVPETLPHPLSRPLRWAFAATAAAAFALVLLTCVRVWLPDYGFTRFINIGREFVPRRAPPSIAPPRNT